MKSRHPFHKGQWVKHIQTGIVREILCIDNGEAWLGTVPRKPGFFLETTNWWTPLSEITPVKKPNFSRSKITHPKSPQSLAPKPQCKGLEKSLNSIKTIFKTYGYDIHQFTETKCHNILKKLIRTYAYEKANQKYDPYANHMNDTMEFIHGILEGWYATKLITKSLKKQLTMIPITNWF